MSTISPTIKLLRVLGSPLISAPEMLVEEDEVAELHDHAVENRLPLYYLETLKKQGKPDKLTAEYEIEIQKQSDLLDEVSKIYRLLKSNHIESIIFKTIRPYPVVPTDVDVLLVNSTDYNRAAALVSKLGYEKEEVKSAEGKHLHPADGGIFVDLRREIALSHIVYLDKKKLIKYATKTGLNGEEVDIFPPEVELAITAAHSVINEEAYTLQDYYLTLFHLAELNSDGVNRFIDIVKENHITRATICHFAVTAILHETAHGVIPDSIKHVLCKLGNEGYETRRLTRNNFKVPHKFHLLTVARAIMEKMYEKRARRSLAFQIVHMLNPSFARSVWSELRKMRKRQRW